MNKSEPERIGNVWLKSGRLFCSAFIPSDAYFSLPDSLSAGNFVEMKWTVRDLRYGKGNMDSIELDWELSDLEEEIGDYSGDAVAVVDPIY